MVGTLDTHTHDIRHLSKSKPNHIIYILKPRIKQKMSPRNAFSRDPVQCIIEILIIVGALNWLTIGFFNYDFVTKLFKSFSKYIFMTVGIAGVIRLFQKLMWIMV
jgi:uncharacterized membrane protein YuzA (DUF378 family)